MEIALEISKYIEDKQNHIKFNMAYGLCENCCSDYDEDKYYHTCDKCDLILCDECYNMGDVYYKTCYLCNETVCTYCSSSDTYSNLYIQRCEYIDCYYCMRGQCYNNKTKMLCETCNESDSESKVEMESDTESIGSNY